MMVFKIKIELFDYVRTFIFALSVWIPWFFFEGIEAKLSLIFLPILVTFYFLIKLESIEFYENTIIIKKSFLLLNFHSKTINKEELKNVRVYFSSAFIDTGYIIDFNFWKLDKQQRSVRLYSKKSRMEVLENYFNQRGISFTRE